MSAFRTWSRRVAVGLAAGYLAAILIVTLLLRFVGEAHWATTIGLYLPALGFVLPALPVALFLCLTREFRWLIAVGSGALVAVFFLMGLRLPTSGGSPEPGSSLRIFSWNVNSGHGGQEAIFEEIRAKRPDIVLLQESDFGRDQLLSRLREHYPEVVVSTQFITASRFPILETTEPPRIPYFGKLRSPRYVRHRVETPLGNIAVYNVHPLSPRESLAAVRGAGLREEIRSGRLFLGSQRRTVEANTGLRVLQVEAIARDVRRELIPVLVAGDTNLPESSALFRRELGALNDAFATAGKGFGTTFPTKWSFLRLDRILGSDGLSFAAFEVDCGKVSDHACVFADVSLSR